MKRPTKPNGKEIEKGVQVWFIELPPVRPDIRGKERRNDCIGKQLLQQVVKVGHCCCRTATPIEGA